MQAIILAAGRGSRLAPLTDDLPKCLVQLHGRALIDRSVSSLRAGGVDRITVIGGYRADALRSRLADGSVDRIVVNERWSSTNMVATMMSVADDLRREPALIVYGDIFFGPQIVRDLVDSSATLAVAYDPDGVRLWTERFSDPLADLEDFCVSQQGSVTRIGQRVESLATPDGQYMGLVAMTPTAFGKIEGVLGDGLSSTVDMTTLLQQVINVGQVVAAVPNRSPWGEIDSPSDLSFFHDRSVQRA